MNDPRVQLRNATRARAAAQNEWVAALHLAIESGLTFAETAQLAGVSRGRVAQIVGRTGRSPGRRKRS